VQYAVRFAGRDIQVDPTAFVSRRAIIRVIDGGSVRIGAKCEIHDYAMILTYGGDIVLGEESSLNPFSIIYGHGGTIVGRGVRIAAHSIIVPANHMRGDDENPGLRRGVTATGIAIGDYTWIGSGCKILDGVTIGRHVVVGAGSVVTRSVPDNTTVVGVPAKPVASAPV
jgi:acetyltransferase-like isoleucine patch superfamily enzyme